MRWNCMSKSLRFLQITAEHQDCPFFTVFLTTKSLSQNISITLLQISLKLHEHRGCYWRKKLSWMIFEEQFPVPRYTAASKIGNSVISLLWQLWCRCNTDHTKFSSSSNTTVVAIFPKLCLWRRSLCSNLKGIGPEKLYRATLTRLFSVLKFDSSLIYDWLCNVFVLRSSSLTRIKSVVTATIPLASSLTWVKGEVKVTSMFDSTFDKRWRNYPFQKLYG